MKEKEQQKEMSVLNLVLWLFGAFYLGWMIRQILINVSGIEINYDLYEKNYAIIQLCTYLPFAILAVKATGAKFVKYITALLTIFSLYLINTAADMAAQLDNPWKYITEKSELTGEYDNLKEVFQYFTNQIIWLLPFVIGYVLVELLKIVLPKLAKIEAVKKALDWMKNFWTDKIKRLTSRPAKVTKKVESEEEEAAEEKEVKETKEEVKSEEKEVEKKEDSKKSTSKKNKRSKKKKKK